MSEENRYCIVELQSIVQDLGKKIKELEASFTTLDRNVTQELELCNKDRTRLEELEKKLETADGNRDVSDVNGRPRSLSPNNMVSTIDGQSEYIVNMTNDQLEEYGIISKKPAESDIDIIMDNHEYLMELQRKDLIAEFIESINVADSECWGEKGLERFYDLIISERERLKKRLEEMK